MLASRTGSRLAWRLRRGALVAVVSLALVAGCAQQQIRETAEAQMRAGEYEQALQSMELGLRDYPDSATLQAGLAAMKATAIEQLVGEAANARAQGKPEQAEQALRRALTLQPGNQRLVELIDALNGERRQRAALAEAEALVAQRKPATALRVLNEALKSNPRQPELLALQRKLEGDQRLQQLRSALPGLAETRPITLDFRDANLRSVLEVVSRDSGINFIFDKDIKPDARVTVFVRSARVEDAIDLIIGTHQLSKKLVDNQTVLIYPNTAEKHREYQEQVVRVFYLSSAEAKGAAAFLRSMLRIREPYVDERSNMLALRDSQENVQLAERLVALYDANDPEVQLEVQVIEIRTARLTELGVKFPDTFSLTVLPPAGETGLTLDNVRGLTPDRIGLSIAGVTVNLKRETGDFNLLANPRIRVKNREKAKIMIGDKVPVVSAVTGQTGFVSESVSYLDVGLKLDVEPTVYIDDEVTIRIALEVSSLGNAVQTTSGTLAYQIGTRNASTLLRLRDGETQYLAGLISNEDRSDASRVPGLGDLPVMGRLFSSTRDERLRTELVLSITPRVVRNVRRLDAAESEVWVGTEAQPRLRMLASLSQHPIEVAAIAPGALRPAAREAGAQGAAPPSPDGASPAAATAPALQWSGPAKVKTGDTFVVRLALTTEQSLRGLPMQLAYSKDVVEVLGIDEGDFFKRDGVATSFSHAVNAAAGRATAGVLRNPATGVGGQGDVLTLRLKAVSAGAAELSVLEASPIGLAGPVARPAVLPMLRIDVQ